MMAKLPFFRHRGGDRPGDIETGSGGLPTHVRRTSSQRTSSQTAHAGAEELGYNAKTRPAFIEWVKLTAWDVLTLLVLGAIALAVFSQPPAMTRTFPVTFSQSFPSDRAPSPSLTTNSGTTGSGDVVWPEYAYPYREQIIPSYADSLLALGIPIIVILVCQVRVWSFWDVNNGVFGVIQSVLSGTVFQVIIKCVVGGLRPHFYDVCQPDPSLAQRPGGNSSGLEGTGFGGIFYTRAICTSGNEEGIDNSLESFPSGHTTAAFAGFVFLSLYLNAKLKVFSDHQVAMWKLAATWSPLLVATIIAGSLTVDQTHNWYDIVAGAVIGISMAFMSYRGMYASVWDWRTNHIPLHRKSGYVYDETEAKAYWTVTRSVGWGSRRRSTGRKARWLAAQVRKRGGGEKGGSTESEMPMPVPVAAEDATERYTVSPGRDGHIQGTVPAATTTSSTGVQHQHQHQKNEVAVPRRAVPTSSSSDSNDQEDVAPVRRGDDMV